MTHERAGDSSRILSRLAKSRAMRNDAIAQPQRTRLTLDQTRIDLLKALRGVTTEAEAIAAAMNVTLVTAAFGSEVRAGGAELLKKGGVVNHFDDEASLDFSGFMPDSLPAARKR